MFKIFDSIYKIITLPLTLLSIPFKVIDFIFKIFGLIVLVAVIYYFNWFPALNSFIDNYIPWINPFVTSIKKALGLANDAKNALPLKEANEGINKVIQARDLLNK
jgi:F0F1-type ATP synthase membrane subunit b/b'